MQKKKKQTRRSRRLAMFKEWEQLKEIKKERSKILTERATQKLKNSSKSISLAIAKVAELLHHLKATEGEALAIKAIDIAQGKETEGPEFFEDLKQTAEVAASICQELQQMRQKLEAWQSYKFAYSLENTKQTEQQQPTKKRAIRCKQCGQFAAIGKPCKRCNYINTTKGND